MIGYVRKNAAALRNAGNTEVAAHLHLGEHRPQRARGCICPAGPRRRPCAAPRAAAAASPRSASSARHVSIPPHSAARTRPATAASDGHDSRANPRGHSSHWPATAHTPNPSATSRKARRTSFYRARADRRPGASALRPRSRAQRTRWGPGSRRTGHSGHGVRTGGGHRGRLGRLRKADAGRAPRASWSPPTGRWARPAAAPQHRARHPAPARPAPTRPAAPPGRARRRRTRSGEASTGKE